MAGQIEHYVRAARQFARRPDGGDPVAFDKKPRIAQFAARPVHRHEHVGMLDEQRCGPRRRCSGA